MNTEVIYKKSQSRLHFLRRLRSFGVCSTMLSVFHQSVVGGGGGLFFAVACWGSGIKATDAGRIDKLLKKAGSVLGVSLDPVGTVAERRVLAKLLAIMDNTTPPPHFTTLWPDRGAHSAKDFSYLGVPRSGTEGPSYPLPSDCTTHLWTN